MAHARLGRFAAFIGSGSLLASGAAAEVIHAVAGGNLVWFDTAQPGVVHPVGPLGTVGGRTLTYNPVDRFLYTIGGAVNSTVLVRVSPATGAGSVIASLPTGAYYEGLEWVGSHSSLVVTSGATPATRTVNTLALSGSIAPLASNTRDNDYCVWDSSRDLFYVTDPNGVAQFAVMNLANGSTSNLGTVALGDAVYSAASDCFYGTIWQTNTLLRIQTTGGAGPITVTNLGTIGGDAVNGMAIIPAPGLAVISLGAVAGGARRRRPAAAARW